MMPHYWSATRVRNYCDRSKYRYVLANSACRNVGLKKRIKSLLHVLVSFSVMTVFSVRCVIAEPESIPGKWALPGSMFLVQSRSSVKTVVTGQRKKCSVAFPATDNSGRHLFITAGHCGREGDPVYSTADMNTAVGRIIFSTNGRQNIERSIDVAVVEMVKEAQLEHHREVFAYSGTAQGRVGDLVCTQDDQTGVSCGVLNEGPRLRTLRVGRKQQIDIFTERAALCSRLGDSGEPVFTHEGIIGLISGGGPADENCADSQWLQLHKFSNNQIMSYITTAQDALRAAALAIPDVHIISDSAA